MANPKSNIYPISLQNAELNLNKFDAEIKNYQGFNKNNSPFVGGCLSNIFTKDSNTISNTSVFVDDEENVYTIGANGLMKNDTVVIPFNAATTKRVEKTKLNVPGNCLKLFNENIYVTYEPYNIQGYNQYFLIYKNQKIELFQSNVNQEFFINKLITGIFVGNFFIFLYSEPNSKAFYLKKIDLQNDIINTNSYSLVGTFVRIDYEYALALTYNETHQQLMVQVRSTNGVVRFIFFNFSDLSFIEEGDDFYIDNGTVSFTPKKYKFFNYPFNCAMPISGESISFRQTALAIKFISPYYDNTDSDVYNIHCEDVEYLTFESPVNIETYECPNYSEFSNLICVYDYTLQASAKYYGLHFNPVKNTIRGGFSVKKRELSQDFITCTFELGDTVSFDIQNENSLQLNINNNKVSSICGNYVNYTDWNVIAQDSIITNSSKDKIYFKEIDNNWYCISLISGVNTFYVLNNQIVLPVDLRRNSYDFKRNKILLFAPRYNNSLIPGSVTEFTSSAQNDLWIASSINEYNLEDNASILLNPVYVADPYSMSFNNDNPDVNVYKGISSDNVIYYKTGKRINVNKQLVGLPYPVDSTGNIIYSPNLFTKVASKYGNEVLIKNNNRGYFLNKSNNTSVFSYYFGTEIDNIDELFIIQGQFYAIIDDWIYSLSFNSGVISNLSIITSVENMQYCGSSPFQALFYSKINRGFYIFNGSNVLIKSQFVDKISEIYFYKYNPATQTNIVVTDIGTLFVSLFGIFKLEYIPEDIFLLKNGIALQIKDSSQNSKIVYIKYYLGNTDLNYTKQNVIVETCFYGLTNETVSINDCLYLRIFSEEREIGELKVSATTFSLEGRKTEETVFDIKSSDWDEITNTIYLRYQPKTQRGLGISFSIDSPFKIASISVGSQADAVLIDNVSKNAKIQANTNNNIEW